LGECKAVKNRKIVMILLAVILFVGFIIWKLLVKGIIFHIIIFSAFIFLSRAYLSANFPDTNATVMNIMGNDISWATVIPVILVILAMATIRVPA
jgi:hypothetical protein